jgi:CheY-like chemotaxis protein
MKGNGKSMKTKPLRILLVEDNPGDAVFLCKELSDAMDTPCQVIHVSRLSEALQELGKGKFDLILLDLGLPDSQGLETFGRLHTHSLDPPIVLLTCLDEAAVAVQAVARGAQDYLIKGRTSGPLLARSLRYAIERNRLVREQDDLILRLQAALAEVKKLSGLLPICANCKKIRNDQGYWQQIEGYIHEHSEADFTHSICPECSEELYPQLVTLNAKANNPT